MSPQVRKGRGSGAAGGDPAEIPNFLLFAWGGRAPPPVQAALAALP